MRWGKEQTFAVNTRIRLHPETDTDPVAGRSKSLPGWIGRCSLALYPLLGLIALRKYIDWESANFIVGLLALYCCAGFPGGSREDGIRNSLRDAGKEESGPSGSGKLSFRFGVAALLVGGLFFLCPVKTLLFFGLAFAFLFALENRHGRMAPGALLIVFLMSPLADYAATMAGFPVRLQLSQWAGSFIAFTGTRVSVEGNLILCDGNEFSVDPACMGLHMLLSSLLAGLAMTGYYQQRFRVSLRFPPLFFYLLTILGLNILANLFRIILLVHFSILPVHLMHGIVGMICLAVYVLIPLIALSRRLVRRYGKPCEQTVRPDPVTNEPAPTGRNRKLLRVHLLTGVVMLAATLITVSREQKEAGRQGVPPGSPSIPGYSVAVPAQGILQLKNAQSLVYLKSIPAFFYTDHSPMICWEGSGYHFRAICQKTLSGYVLNTGMLEKGQERLYTAWWFDNGHKHTPDQLAWRWDALRGGGDYSLVNITADSQQRLEEEVARVLTEQPFNNLLRRGTAPVAPLPSGP